ncbi:hypothetical protein R1sor_019249 [Riccia sorocarpa]|uniref:Uncharacterized protein n=1 Tax=Riccia sorocarpa TaxID=122646 RepID=A0ABD3IEQ0_9MARC
MYSWFLSSFENCSLTTAFGTLLVLSGRPEQTVLDVPGLTSSQSTTISLFVFGGLNDNSFAPSGATKITLVEMVFNKEGKNTDVSFMQDDFAGRIEDSEVLVELRNIRNGIYAIKVFDEVTFIFRSISVHAYNLKCRENDSGSMCGVVGSKMASGTGVSYGAPQTSTMTPNPSVTMRPTISNQFTTPASMPVGSNSVNEFQMHALFDSQLTCEMFVPRVVGFESMFGSGTVTRLRITLALYFYVTSTLRRKNYCTAT